MNSNAKEHSINTKEKYDQQDGEGNLSRRWSDVPHEQSLKEGGKYKKSSDSSPRLQTVFVPSNRACHLPQRYRHW